MKFYFENYPYAFLAMIGFTVSILFALFLLHSRCQANKYFNILIWALLGLLVGARLFGIISRFLYLLISLGKIRLVESIKQSGIVYYGGLIGYIFCAKIICRFKNWEFNDISDVIALSIPLFHFWGRLGCFFSGCCYGKVSNSVFAIPCRAADLGTVENRMPVQLYEAGIEILLFIFLLIIYIKRKSKRQDLLDIYLVLYAIWRFLIEFLRADEVRGVFYFLSFSQILSVLICIYIAYEKRRRKK